MVCHVSCALQSIRSPKGTVASKASKSMVYHVRCAPQSIYGPRGNCSLRGFQKHSLSSLLCLTIYRVPEGTVASEASKSMVCHVSCALQSMESPRELWPQRLPNAWFLTSAVPLNLYMAPEGTVASEASKSMVYHVSCALQSIGSPRELWPQRLQKAWFITSPGALGTKFAGQKRLKFHEAWCKVRIQVCNCRPSDTVF